MGPLRTSLRLIGVIRVTGPWSYGMNVLIGRDARALAVSVSLCLSLRSERAREHTAGWQLLTRQERPHRETYLAGTLVSDFPASKL